VRYNAAGHRVTARLTQADEPGVPGDNSRSQVNAYNALGQLVQSQVGSLDSSGQIIPSSLRRSDAWSLDLLGNWNAKGALDGSGDPLPGRTTRVLQDGPVSTRTLAHATDLQNRITRQRIGTGSQAPEPPVHLAYDGNGNLACDGLYYYQYDAWNRGVADNRGGRTRRTGRSTAPPKPG